MIIEQIFIDLFGTFGKTFLAGGVYIAKQTYACVHKSGRKIWSAVRHLLFFPFQQTDLPNSRFKSM